MQFHRDIEELCDYYLILFFQLINFLLKVNVDTTNAQQTYVPPTINLHVFFLFPYEVLLQQTTTLSSSLTSKTSTFHTNHRNLILN